MQSKFEGPRKDALPYYMVYCNYKMLIFQDSLFPYLVIRQAFEVDSVADANPLNNPNTNTLSEIRDMFSTVTYAKVQ